jgi:hypothetical protein
MSIAPLPFPALSIATSMSDFTARLADAAMGVKSSS